MATVVVEAFLVVGGAVVLLLTEAALVVGAAVTGGTVEAAVVEATVVDTAVVEASVVEASVVEASDEGGATDVVGDSAGLSDGPHAVALKSAAKAAAEATVSFRFHRPRRVMERPTGTFHGFDAWSDMPRRVLRYLRLPLDS